MPCDKTARKTYTYLQMHHSLTIPKTQTSDWPLAHSSLAYCLLKSASQRLSRWAFASHNSFHASMFSCYNQKEAKHISSKIRVFRGPEIWPPTPNICHILGGNILNLPSICIDWSPENGSHFIIPSIWVAMNKALSPSEKKLIRCNAVVVAKSHMWATRKTLGYVPWNTVFLIPGSLFFSVYEI